MLNSHLIRRVSSVWYARVVGVRRGRDAETYSADDLGVEVGRSSPMDETLARAENWIGSSF